MPDDETETRGRVVNRRPEDAGQPMAEEIGATAGKTHDQVLRETLTPDVARKAREARAVETERGGADARR